MVQCVVRRQLFSHRFEICHRKYVLQAELLRTVWIVGRDISVRGGYGEQMVRFWG